MSEKNRPRHKENLKDYAADDESAVEGYHTGGNHMNRTVQKGEKHRTNQKAWISNT